MHDKRYFSVYVCVYLVLFVGSRVVPVRLDKETLTFIDALVKLGVYSSRSEAVRDLIRAGAEKHRWALDVARADDELFKMEKDLGEPPVKLNGALKDLLRERDRF